MHLGEFTSDEWKELYFIVERVIKSDSLTEFRLDINTKNAQMIPQFHLHILSGSFIAGNKNVSEGTDGYPTY